MDDVYAVPGYGAVTKTLRRWWVNCASAPDAEMLAIDALENALSPVDAATAEIRQLISTLECCHHKAERHVEIIMAAIGSGSTTKGQGRRDADKLTPWEHDYQALLQILSAWTSTSSPQCAACFGPYSGRELLALLGTPTPLKIWQVQRVMEKVGRFLDPTARWSTAYAPVIDTAHSGEHAAFSDATKRLVIYDTVDGQPAETTLATAIDLLTGCNWNFPHNIRTILAAIGGEAHAQRPLALHARNLTRNPARGRLRGICQTLRAFTDGHAADGAILPMLGTPTPSKRWLAASLEKTIRLQMGF